MIVRNTSNTFVMCEESPIKKIVDPEYLLKMDKIIFKNGDKFLVTEANGEDIEIMMMTRKRIKKEAIQEFLQDMASVERADCFEL